MQIIETGSMSTDYIFVFSDIVVGHSMILEGNMLFFTRWHITTVVIWHRTVVISMMHFISGVVPYILYFLSVS